MKSALLLPLVLRDNWSLTPHLQLTYSSVNFDDFTDRYGTAVSLADGDRLIGRLGLSTDIRMNGEMRPDR